MTFCYLKTNVAFNGDGNVIRDGCNGDADKAFQISGLCKPDADPESANTVNVCQWACKRTPLNACINSLPVGAKCISNERLSWK